ncbi:MAG: acyltransferase [Hyphomicrobium sp.]|nr:acyltransferase [Hyphomicrobium sp.]
MINRSADYLRDAPVLGSIMAPDANSFGVLRLIMASLVLISHSYMFAFGTPLAEPLTAWTGHSLGQHAVQGFFILSGILVAQSFERSRSLLDFAAARILRIFPGLIVCVLLTAFVLGPLVSQLPLQAYFTSAVLPVYLAKTLSLATGSAPLPGVFNDLPMPGIVNSSLWTLKFEVLCYAGLALAGVAGLFSATYRYVIAGLLAAFLAAIYAIDPQPFTQHSFIDNVRYFAVYFGTGTLIYLLRDKLVIVGAALLPLAAIFVAALDTRFAEPATAALLGYGIVWAASKSFGPLRAWCNKVDLSFGVYIYAGPIQQALIGAAPAVPPIAISLAAFAIVLPLALLSWVLIEHPALRLRSDVRTLLMRWRSRTAPPAAFQQPLR